MHRQHAALREQVICHGEHALLHFAGVLGAEDDQLPVLEAQADAGLRVDAGGSRLAEKPRRCR